MDPLSVKKPLQGPAPQKTNTVLWLLLSIILLIGGFLGGYKWAESSKVAALKDELSARQQEEINELRDRLDAIELVKIRVYFTVNSKVIPLERRVLETADKDAVRLAVEELLAGPNGEELALGVVTRIPKNTALVNLSVEGGTATLTFTEDLNKVEPARTALVRQQIEKTITEFESISRVMIKIQGVEDQEVLKVT